MMKKVSKTVLVLLVAIIVMSTMIPVFGATPAATKEEDSLVGKVNVSTDDAGGLLKIGGSILGIVQIVGIMIAVGMLIVLGIRYVIASANDKAEIKKSAVGYIIGAVIIFAAVGILTVIETFASNLGK